MLPFIARSVILNSSAHTPCSYASFTLCPCLFKALILPLPPVIVVLSNSNYQYTIPDFPPYFCLSASLNGVVFYSMVLIINLLLAAGVCLFIPIFYIIHKVSDVSQ